MLKTPARKALRQNPVRKVSCDGFNVLRSRIRSTLSALEGQITSLAAILEAGIPILELGFI